MQTYHQSGFKKNNADEEILSNYANSSVLTFFERQANFLNLRIEAVASGSCLVALRNIINRSFSVDCCSEPEHYTEIKLEEPDIYFPIEKRGLIESLVNIVKHLSEKEKLDLEHFTREFCNIVSKT